MSLIPKVSSIVVLFSHPSLPGTPVGYPGVRIAPVVDWSGGFHGAFDGTVFQCCSPVGCETAGLDSGSISLTGLGGVLPVNRLQTYIHRCRPTQAPCGLQSHETSRVSTHCTLKSKAACLRLFGFRLGEKDALACST